MSSDRRNSSSFPVPPVESSTGVSGDPYMNNKQDEQVSGDRGYDERHEVPALYIQDHYQNCQTDQSISADNDGHAQRNRRPSHVSGVSGESNDQVERSVAIITEDLSEREIESNQLNRRYSIAHQSHLNSSNLLPPTGPPSNLVFGESPPLPVASTSSSVSSPSSTDRRKSSAGQALHRAPSASNIENLQYRYSGFPEDTRRVDTSRPPTHPLQWNHYSLSSNNTVNSNRDMTGMIAKPPLHWSASEPIRTVQSFATRIADKLNPSNEKSPQQHPHLELTTKGRKRKRLAKACSACHKNKRRCDGFAPCSNCEFSSRTCVYINAAGEAIPPPRTRDDSTKDSPEDIPAKTALEGKPYDHGFGERPPVDLSWARERAHQREHDLLYESKQFSEQEAIQAKSIWLDAREREWQQARVEATMDVPRKTSWSKNGLGIDLTGDGSRVRTAATSSHSYSAGGSQAPISGPASSLLSGGGASDGGPSGLPNGYRRDRDSQDRERRERDEAWYSSVVDRVDADDILIEELCHQFFARMHPYQLMFHLPTFTYRRYLNQIPPALLHIIYAFASRFTDHRVFVPPSAMESDGRYPAFARGEVLAARARHETDAWLRASGIAKGDSAMEGILKRRSDPFFRVSWDDTEMIQAICLIGYYEQCMGRSSRAGQYFDISIELLRVNSGAPQNVLSHEDVATVARRSITLTECRTRTMWMLYLADVSASTNGRPRRLKDIDLAETLLPGNEAAWNRAGGYNTNRPRAPFRLISGDIEAYDVGEFGHVIRILSVFSSIMELSNRGLSHSPSDLTPQQLEDALRSWAMSLPTHLMFNENNFVASLNKLASPVAFLSASGFCFALSHSLAESSQFYLQSAAALSGEVDAAQTAIKQSLAVDNLAVILDTIGDIGRHSPQMFFPLHIVSNWIAHTSASLPPGRSPSAASQRTETKLNQWWQDLGAVWGVERRAAPRLSHSETAPPRQIPGSSSSGPRTQMLPPITTRAAGPTGGTFSPGLQGTSSVTLPPLRKESQMEPDRIPTITPRRLTDLLHTRSSPTSKPDGLPAISTARSWLEGSRVRSPQPPVASAKSPRPASEMDDAANDSLQREPKKPRLSAEQPDRRDPDSPEQEAQNTSQISGLQALVTAAEEKSR